MTYSKETIEKATKALELSKAILDGKVIEYKLSDEFIKGAVNKLVNSRKHPSEKEAYDFITWYGTKDKWREIPSDNSILEDGFNLYSWEFRIKD